MNSEARQLDFEGAMGGMQSFFRCLGCAWGGTVVPIAGEPVEVSVQNAFDAHCCGDFPRKQKCLP
jgi:hypothetical protein